ncbi:MAG TPA: hypothetical protein VJZ27_13535, partial [Aggregatilineales bacterium]|nr:hypothetical protein [Aggregatilineales bacterium]
KIIENSDQPPIIVLQSDHGPDPDVDWGLEEHFLRQRLPNLSAYHLPNGGEEAVYPSITPVNIFRAILNYYFAAGLPLLEDRSFYSNWYTNAFYDFTEVTLQPIFIGENITIARSWDETRYAVQTQDETLVSFESSRLEGESLILESDSGWMVELTPDSETSQIYHVLVENPDGQPVETGFIDLRIDEMTRLGMSQAVYHDFLAYRAAQDFPESDAVLFNPAAEPAVLPRDLARVGRLITTIPDILGTETINAYFNLLTWLDNTRYEAEINLTSDEADSITAWRNGFMPGHLKDAGIDYLVFDDVWWSFVTDDLVAIIQNPDYYEPIDEWLVYYRYGEGDFYPETIGYHVYRVVGDAR